MQRLCPLKSLQGSKMISRRTIPLNIFFLEFYMHTYLRKKAALFSTTLDRVHLLRNSFVIEVL